MSEWKKLYFDFPWIYILYIVAADWVARSDKFVYFFVFTDDFEVNEKWTWLFDKSLQKRQVLLFEVANQSARVKKRLLSDLFVSSVFDVGIIELVN